MKVTYIIDQDILSDIRVPEANERGHILIEQDGDMIDLAVDSIDDLISALKNQKMAHEESQYELANAEQSEPDECGKYRQPGDMWSADGMRIADTDRYNGPRDRCIKPAGHDGAHEDLDRSTWIGSRG